MIGIQRQYEPTLFADEPFRTLCFISGHDQTAEVEPSELYIL